MHRKLRYEPALFEHCRIYYNIESLKSPHLELLHVPCERLSKQFFGNVCKPDKNLTICLKKEILPHVTCQPITVQCQKLNATKIVLRFKLVCLNTRASIDELSHIGAHEM